MAEGYYIQEEDGSLTLVNEPPAPTSEIKSTYPEGIIGQAQSWLAQRVDPLFGKSKGVAEDPQGYITQQNGQSVPVVTSSEQEPGLKKGLAFINELVSTGIGGAGGAAGGEAIGGPPGAYIGSALGAEAGYTGALTTNKALGLRPNSPEFDPVTQLKNAPSRVVLDLAFPQVLRFGAKGVKSFARSLAQPLEIGANQLATFRNKPLQLARAFSDTVTDFEDDVAKNIQAVPEIFQGVQVGPAEGLDVFKPAFRKGGDLLKGEKTTQAQLTNPMQTILENIQGLRDAEGNVIKQGLKDKTGQALDEIIGQSPQKIRLGNLNLKRLDKLLKEKAPNDQTKAARSVYNTEMDNFAKLALSEEEFATYQAAKRDLNRFETAKAKASVVGGAPSEELTTRALYAEDIVKKAEAAINDLEFTPLELRSFKTSFDSLARYDLNNIPDRFDAMKASAYREWGNIFREALDGVVKKDTPELYKAYKALSQKYKAYIELEPLIERREAQMRERGVFFRTGQFSAKEGPLDTDIPVISPLLRKMFGAKYPQSDMPMARLQYGLGERPSLLLQGAQVGLDASSIGARVLEKGAKKLETTLGAPGVQQHLPMATSIGGQILSQSIDDAQAQERTAINLLPRSSEALFALSTDIKNTLPPELQDFLEQGKQLAPELQSRFLSDLLETDPALNALFEPSMIQGFNVVDGRINNPLHRQVYAQALQKQEANSYSPDPEITKELNALNKDGTVLNPSRLTSGRVQLQNTIQTPAMPIATATSRLADNIKRQAYDY